jgi:hypothetical protein
MIVREAVATPRRPRAPIEIFYGDEAGLAL